MTTEITRGFADPTKEFEFQWRLAQVAARSGYYPDARAPEQAMAKIRLGAALGLSETQSLIGIHIVEGKPQIAAVTLASFLRPNGYDYRVRHLDNESCTIEFFRGAVDDGESLGRSEFTIEDARRAGLVKDKSGWVKYPRNMLFARAMSNGVKWYCSDATHGIPVYHEGEIVEATVVEDATQGTGDGHAPDDFEPSAEVEAVLRRAQELRFAAIADRGTAWMALGGKSPEAIARWVAEKTRELDEFEQAKGTSQDSVESEAKPGGGQPANAPPADDAVEGSPLPTTAQSAARPVDVESLRDELARINARYDEPSGRWPSEDQQRKQEIEDQLAQKAERHPVEGQEALDV